jgi:hypothetical protein
VPLNEPGLSATTTPPSAHQSAACVPETSWSLSESVHVRARPMCSGLSAVCSAARSGMQQLSAAPPCPISHTTSPSRSGRTYAEG